MIDAQQHFWRLGRGEHDWPTVSEAPIYRDFGGKDLVPLQIAAGMWQAVLVQATPAVCDGTARASYGLAPS